MTTADGAGPDSAAASSKAARLRRIMLAVMLVILALTTYFLIRVVRIEPRMLSILSAETEKVSHRVWNPGMSAIRVEGMGLVRSDDGDRTCVRGLLTPPVGMMLTYVATGPSAEGGGVVVAATSAGEGGVWSGVLRDAGGGPVAVPADFILVEDPKCPGSVPRRLPIWGAIEVGDEVAAATDEGEPQRLFLSGQLTLYGRAATEIPILSTFTTFEPVLYPVGEMKVPFGSRLVGGQADPNSPWRGVARHDGSGKLSLEASTEARDISIYAPGTSRTAETIVPSAMTQLTNDPNLVAFQIYFAAAAFFAGMLSIMTGLAGIVPLPGKSSGAGAGPAESSAADAAPPAPPGVDEPSSGPR